MREDHLVFNIKHDTVKLLSSSKCIGLLIVNLGNFNFIIKNTSQM